MTSLNSAAARNERPSSGLPNVGSWGSSNVGSSKASKAVDWAQSQVGVSERKNPGTVKGYSRGKWQAWCADFVSTALKKGGGSPFGHQSSVQGILNWGKGNKGHFMSAGQAGKQPGALRKGDIAVWKQNGKSHVGLVTGVNKNGTFNTVEGNTSDAVRNRTHSFKNRQLTGFVRPHGKFGEAAPDAADQAAAAGKNGQQPGAGQQNQGTQPAQGVEGQPKLELGRGQFLSQRHNKRGPKVKQLQEMLNASGANLKTDGVIGPKTSAAIKKFQKQKGLDVDGIVGPKTLAALNGGAQQGAQNGGQPNQTAAPGQEQNQGPSQIGNVTGDSLAKGLPKPLKGLANDFVAAGKKYNIDPRFLAAISMLETGNGTSSAFRNKNNAMGVSNRSGPIRFKNKADGIYKMAKTLANPNGYYKGATTINKIGRIYAPPGAGNDPNGTNGYWPRGVSKFYRQLGGDPSQAVLQR